MKKSFCFILNPLEVTGELPLEIIPNHWFQKANEEQIALIRPFVERHTHSLTVPAYEYTMVGNAKKEGESASRSSQRLPPEKLRYWVFEFDGPKRRTQDLRMAVNLLKKDLDLGPNFVYGPDLSILSQGSYSSFFEANSWLIDEGVLAMTTDEISSVTSHFHSIEACEKDQSFVHQTVNNFFQLKSLPRRSPMMVLGYFSVIEALITHNPKDDFDSLNHQISTKMVLLSKRFERQLDYEEHFGSIDQERVWKKLYGYRSALAHGTRADFKKDLSCLKDAANAREFLKEATKLTLLYAMKDPELVTDLKNC